MYELDRFKINGVINSDGRIGMGQGFRCQKAGIGFYVITFDHPLEDPPIAICTLEGTPKAIHNKTVSIISISSDQIVCATSSVDAPEDLGFKFIALSHGQSSQSGVNGSDLR